MMRCMHVAWTFLQLLASNVAVGGEHVGVVRVQATGVLYLQATGSSESAAAQKSESKRQSSAHIMLCLVLCRRIYGKVQVATARNARRFGRSPGSCCCEGIDCTLLKLAELESGHVETFNSLTGNNPALAGKQVPFKACCSTWCQPGRNRWLTA
jgi:hypothetical protein